jgi:two-component system sensor histidine kinase DesK
MGLVFVPLIGGVNVHYAELRRRDARLRLAHDEISQLGALAERERIARDLHDLLGHTLSVIVLKAELAAKLVTRDAARAAQEIGDVERISREALVEVRRAVQGFKTASLADEVVRARGVLASAGVALEGNLVTDSDLSASVEGLDPRSERALAFVLRECITNVVRHAGARLCRVTLARDGPLARLEIRDDGRGGGAAEGNGFQGMRARLAEIGGTLERDGSRGMAVRALAPWSAPRADVAGGGAGRS